MNWEQLLSLRRQGDTSKRYALNKTTPDWVLKWIMIVLFSLPLSEVYKTQVIPLSKTDFVHQTDAQFSFGCGTFFRKIGWKENN
jgi:dGTPase